MKSPIEKLTMMANQIAAFFGSYPHDEAVVGVAGHIEAFWTPKMIQTLKDSMDGLDGLNPLVREALSPEIAAMETAEKAEESPGKVSEPGAVDAG